MAAAKLRDNCISLPVTNRNSRFSSQRPHTISSSRDLSHYFSIGRGVGLGDLPQTPISKLLTAVSIRLGNARGRHTLPNLYASALGPSRIWFERKRGQLNQPEKTSC